MREAYGRAIDILMTGSVNYRDIAVALAKACPEVFVELANGTHQSYEQDTAEFAKFNAELLHLMLSGKKVAAIRQCCTVTGMGVKDSKNYVEAIEAGKEVDAPSCFKTGAWMI